MTILVSAGHGPTSAGGFDPGAVYLGFQEHAEALLWRDEIVRMGELLGAPFDTVPEVPLADKVSHINRRCSELGGKHLAIEMHFNAAAAPGPRGCETLYCPAQFTKSSKGAVLAQLVQDAIQAIYPPDRGIKEAWYRMDPQRGPDYFCAATICPAVICEPEFIYERLAIQGRREATCEVIARALVKAHRILCS